MKKIAYKLTDSIMKTYGGYLWTLGEFNETSGKGGLCGPGWLHYYSDAKLAAFLNPMHAKFAQPRLFEIEVQGKIKEDRGLKYGCTKMRLVKELKFVEPTKKQLVKFAIYCTLEVCKDAAFIKWATNWLNGTDRSVKTAKAAARAARAADDWFPAETIDVAVLTSKANTKDDLAYSAADLADDVAKNTKKKINFAKIAAKAMAK
jgi:hypothetical protein